MIHAATGPGRAHGEAGASAVPAGPGPAPGARVHDVAGLLLAEHRRVEDLAEGTLATGTFATADREAATVPRLAPAAFRAAAEAAVTAGDHARAAHYRTLAAAENHRVHGD